MESWILVPSCKFRQSKNNIHNMFKIQLQIFEYRVTWNVCGTFNYLFCGLAIFEICRNKFFAARIDWNFRWELVLRFSFRAASQKGRKCSISSYNKTSPVKLKSCKINVLLYLIVRYSNKGGLKAIFWLPWLTGVNKWWPEKRFRSYYKCVIKIDAT